MATGVQLTVTVPAALRRNLKPKGVFAAPLKIFFNAVTRDFLVEARQQAPKDLGGLRRAHKRYVSQAALPLFGRVEVDSDTAIYVHYGTRPHWAPLRALEGWAARRGVNPYALQRSIAKKGTRANPWFARAIDTAAEPILRKHAPALVADITQAWGS